MGVDWASHAVTTAWTAGTPFIFVSKSDITKDEVEKALDKHFGEGYYQLASPEDPNSSKILFPYHTAAELEKELKKM